MRADSAFYGRGTVGAALGGGADVSVTVRPGPSGQEGHRRDRPRRVDPHRVPRRGLRRGHGTLGLPGRGRRDPVHRVHRRSKKSNQLARPSGGAPYPRPEPGEQAAGQDTLFDTWRFHAFFTTTDRELLDTVAADKTHRGHAIIEQVHADLKNSALAHLPSGEFTANAAWLVLAVMAFNLTRAAATITGTGPGEGDHRDDPAQADHRPRPDRALRPPDHPAPTQAWPWETAWTQLFDRLSDPPPALAT